MMHDYNRANLDPQTRGMLHFAVKLTREPHSMRPSDVEKLRELGLTDEQILSVVLITCNFNFMTRLADGLGVEIEPQKQDAINQWLGGPTAQQEWLITPKDQAVTHAD